MGVVRVVEVNAFTAGVNGGNGAGVVFDADNMSSEEMLVVAAKVGFSETAFVSSSVRATHKIRFFTPTEEVDLCGHATVATWSLMLQLGKHQPGIYSQETLAGILGVTISEDGLVFMQQKEPMFFDMVDIKELSQALGIGENDYHEQLKPQIVSTGLKDILVPIKDEAILSLLAPNFEALTELSKKYAVIGLHVFCLIDNQPSVAAARNFAPLVGIPEESATGTSNGALLCYLREHGALRTGACHRIEQGRAMHKLSYIYGKFENNSIWIGGHATVIKTLELKPYNE